MAQRFRPSGRRSFWGDDYLELSVAQDHFLRRLKDVLDWEELRQDLADCYKGGAEYGRVPYHPAVPFKMLLVSYLYNLSERQVEQFANENLPARYFLGLGGHQCAPDHSTLTVFKERIIKKTGERAFEERFRAIVRTAQEAGIVLGRIQVVDATHSLADVDVRGDEERQEGGAALRDSDAAWGSKGKQRTKTVDGMSVLTNKFFYGYKAHVSVNAESGLITAVVVTPGNHDDGKQFAKLVAKDEAAGVMAEVYAGDRGYDYGENHELLRVKGKQSALCLKEYRTQKKDRNKHLWLRMKASQVYWQGQGQRYRVEQKTAEAKRYHGLGRCRYVGLVKYGLQAFLTAMAVNLKRMVWLLCGVRLRGTPGVVAGA